MRRRDGAFGDASFVFLEAPEKLVDDPVGGELAVARLGGHGFEIGRVGGVGGEHGGVIIREAEIGHEAGLLGVGQFGQAGLDVVDPGLFDLQRQQVGIGEVAVVVGLFLGAH